MKIKHAVVLEEEELNSLFNPIVECCTKSYPTQEAMDAAINSAKVDFETLLNRYTHKIFKMGKRIGKANADEKDLLMYAGPSP